MVLFGNGKLGSHRICLVVGPPELLAWNPISEFPDTDLLGWEFGPQCFHDLVEDDAHGSLLLVLGDGDNVDIGARGGGQVVVDPCEHGIRDGVGVDLPEEGEVGQLAWGASLDLGGGVGDAQCDIRAEPGAVDLVADFPGIDLRKGGDVVDEPLFVLGTRQFFIVGGIHGLAEHLEAFGFRIVDQIAVGGRGYSEVKYDADPSERSGELGCQVEIRLVARYPVDRKAEPGHELGFVIACENRTVLREEGVVGDGKLVQRELAGLAFG